MDGNLCSLSTFFRCFSVWSSSPIFFGCFMSADHANFILLTFREILVLNQKIPHRTTSNFVPPPALIICQRAHAPVECTASTTLPATVSQHTVTSSPSLVLHGPWWCPGPIKSWLVCLPEYSLQGKRSCQREFPYLEYVPPESDSNEVPTSPLHSLASNLRLPDPWHRFYRLYPR